MTMPEIPTWRLLQMIEELEARIAQLESRLAGP